MDKHEAERLATAIRHALVDWIRVQAVEWNQASNTYEIHCSYKQKARGLRSSWTPLWINPPAVDRLTDKPQ
jgi:hypothetical protein